jgi:hypothetical protein
MKEEELNDLVLLLWQIAWIDCWGCFFRLCSSADTEGVAILFIEYS